MINLPTFEILINILDAKKKVESEIYVISPLRLWASPNIAVYLNSEKSDVIITEKTKIPIQNITLNFNFSLKMIRLKIRMYPNNQLAITLKIHILGELNGSVRFGWI
jgi:hypothetical protein